MKGGNMYNCPSCGNGFTSKYINVTFCPFCGAKYKEIFMFHINMKKMKNGEIGASDGRYGTVLCDKLYERFKTVDYRTELSISVRDNQVVLYLTPILPKETLELKHEPIAGPARPDISQNLAESRRKDLEAMRDA